MQGLGSHLIAELFNCSEYIISDANKIEEVMLKAAKLSKTTVIKKFFHEFSPFGISGVLIIAESHFTIHTWPEYAYAAVDIFTCGDIEYQPAVDYIKNEFEAKECSVFHFNRGIIPDIKINKDTFKWREIQSAKFIKER